MEPKRVGLYTLFSRGFNLAKKERDDLKTGKNKLNAFLRDELGHDFVGVKDGRTYEFRRVPTTDKIKQIISRFGIDFIYYSVVKEKPLTDF